MPSPDASHATMMRRLRAMLPPYERRDRATRILATRRQLDAAALIRLYYF